jgi:hypothetical protein
LGTILATICSQVKFKVVGSFDDFFCEKQSLAFQVLQDALLGMETKDNIEKRALYLSLLMVLFGMR